MEVFYELWKTINYVVRSSITLAKYFNSYILMIFRRFAYFLFSLRKQIEFLLNIEVTFRVKRELIKFSQRNIFRLNLFDYLKGNNHCWIFFDALLKWQLRIQLFDASLLYH